MGRLILGGFLLAAGGAVQADWGLALDGGVIQAVGPNRELERDYPGHELLDCRDKIISPGFVNAHMHAYGVLAHGIQVPARIDSFEAFLNDFWWPQVENRIDQEMVRVTSLNAARELLDSGVTCFCDVLEAPSAIPGALEAAAAALDPVGIRAVLSFEACQRISPQNGRQGLDENRDFSLTYRDHPRIRGMICTHTSFTCDREFVQAASGLAHESGAGLQFHLSESRHEAEWCMRDHGCLPVELYESWGVLGPKVLASQGVKLTTKEMDLLAKRGVNLVHVPLSNCEVGGGVSPVPDLLERGVNLALGTDGYINNFFEVMRGAFLIHKGVREDPEIMPAARVFELATKGGGKALGKWPIGELRPGYRADLITIQPDLPTPVNEHNLYEQLILFCNPAQVKEVLVEGKLVKQNGRLLALDETEIKAAVRQQALRLWGEQS